MIALKESARVFVAVFVSALLFSLSQTGFAQSSAQARPDPGAHRRKFLEQRTFGNKKIPRNAYDRALNQWERMPRTVSRLKRRPRKATGTNTNMAPLSAVTSLDGVVWTAFGPSPILESGSFVNGRVNAIAITPGNANQIFAGAAGGGLWVSTDALSTTGAHWKPLYDKQASLGVGEPSSVAIDPSNPNNIFVGTSNEDGQVFNLTRGVLKSTDGGGSWTVLGLDCQLFCLNGAYDLFANVANVNGIIVDPSSSNTVYLASNSGQATSSGMFLSQDGGQTWTQGVDGSANPIVVGAQSMVLDSTATGGKRNLYAGANGVGIYHSNDGATWNLTGLTATSTVIQNALANVPAGCSPGTGIGRIDIALAPPTAVPNPNGIQVIYATIQGTGGFFSSSKSPCVGSTTPLGIFQTIDGGNTWTQRTASGLGGCFCFFAMVMAVDPSSAGDGSTDTLYWGGQTNSGAGYYKSTDAGNTFSDVTNGTHVDAHSFALTISGGGTEIFTGNDGGIWRSDNGAGTWTGTGGSPLTINGGGLQDALFYHIDVKNDSTASVTLGALQDNGIVQTASLPTWNSTSCGDGVDVVFDKVNTNQAYATFSCSSGSEDIFESTDSGGSFPNTIGSTGGIPASELGGFGNQVAADPNNANFVYVSGSKSQLFQTKNAATFTSIATFTTNPGPVDVAPANSNYVAVGVGGQVWVSTNALGATPSFTNIPGLPGRGVSKVAFDPNDPTVIYATVSGFNSQTHNPGHVFRTTITSNSWTDISPSVASTEGFLEALDLPFNTMALDGGSTPTTIYAGTDLGVVRSVDGGVSWTVLDDIHMPNVPVTDLRINEQAGVLRASTFGRGVFDFAPATGPVIAVNVQNGLNFGNVCPNSSTTLTIQVFNVGTQNLIVNSVSNLFNTADFTVLPNPPTPVTISPNAEVDFTVEFAPTTTDGGEVATFRISSNDPGAPHVDLPAVGNASGPAVGTLMADSGNYGNVCVGSFLDLPLTISNSGGCSLLVNDVSTPASSGFLAPTPFNPFTISSSNSTQVPIRFQPTSFGAYSTNVLVNSNDPFFPNVNVPVTGNAPPPGIKVTGDATFGNVCGGTLAEKTINVCDFPSTGSCSLNVTSATLTASGGGACTDFTLVNDPFPAVVSGNSCLNLTVKFTPTSAGSKSCNLTISSNDPATPSVTLPVTADTPLPQINIPPDLGFPPTVIQSVGLCKTPEPFPISNIGSCNLNINNVTLSGTNATDYSFLGLPSLPTPLEPGHVLGEGNMDTVLGPLALGRNRDGILTVTYESDPVTHATTSVSRNVCGEGVKTGARLLVTAGGVPVPTVKKIQLNRVTGGKTVDVASNLPLQTVTPTIAACSPFMFHREWGTVSNPIQLVTGSYRLTVTINLNGKTVSKTVSFSVNTCDFNPNIVVNF